MERDGLHMVAELSRRELTRIATAGGRLMAEADKIGALRDAAQALDGLGAPWALIGGVAVGIRSGVPRATLDTDLAVASGVARDAVVSAFLGAGFSLRGEFVHSANFRHSSGEPVQVVFDPQFDPMIQRAEQIPFGDLAVRVVTTSDLIEMKDRAASDPARRRSKALRDAADAALLRGD